MNIQSVHSNNADSSAPTRFILPNYSSSTSACPIASVDIIDSNAPGWETASASSKFNSVQTSGSDHVAIPVDIKLNLKYEFYLRVTA